jgi:amino acid adenylation domain-containing protein
MNNHCSNMAEVLHFRAAADPERVAYTFLPSDGRDERSYTYEQLLCRSQLMAACFSDLNCLQKTVLVVAPPGLGLITAFWGCINAGAVSVLQRPPAGKKGIEALATVAKDSDSRALVTTEDIYARIQRAGTPAGAFLSKLPCILIDQLSWDTEPIKAPPVVLTDDIALIQYTSGSTGRPRGVMISHGNLLHCESAIRSTFGHDQDSVIVGWLPLYHDMGLIGQMIQPIYLGARCVFMSPESFIERPIRWLEVVSRYRATTSGGPNFAYELCARRVHEEEIQGLDLSTWQTAFCGAEPIRAETLDRFASRFGSIGFRRSAFLPCYGLAEATLLVAGHVQTEEFHTISVASGDLTTGRIGVQPPNAERRQLVGCGNVIPDHELLIVNPKTQKRCEDGHIGEIWLRGPVVAKGYWQAPAETLHTFGAFLVDNPGTTYLRTGDLGALVGGDVVITGRSKDLIVLRGLNYYPSDIESSVQDCHPSLRLDCCAAFSVDDGVAERMVLVQEIIRGREDMITAAVDAIRAAVHDQCNVTPSEIVIVRAGSIPKTTSGKIKRSKCRELHEAGQLPVLHRWRVANDLYPKFDLPSALATLDPSQVDVERWLLNELKTVTGRSDEELGPMTPMSSLAIDSLAATQVIASAQHNLGLSLTLEDVWSDLIIAEVATRMLSSLGNKSPAAMDPNREGGSDKTNIRDLSYGQQAMWFLHSFQQERAPYNLCFAAKIITAVDGDLLRSTFNEVIQNHSLLKTLFPLVDGAPSREIANTFTASLEVDATNLADAAVRALIMEDSRRRFPIDLEPPVRAKFYKRSSGQYWVALNAHHIIADLFSLGLILNEWMARYHAVLAEQVYTAKQENKSYDEYVSWLKDFVSSEAGEAAYGYWSGVLDGKELSLNLPWDHRRLHRETFHGASFPFECGAPLTAKLRRLAGAESCTIFMVLLATFQTLLYRYTGNDEISVGSPMSGRTRVEWSNVVGYFVNSLPLVTRFTPDSSFVSILRSVRETVRLGIKNQDYPYSLLVERLNPSRDTTGNPFFQTMFTFESTPPGCENGAAAIALGRPGMKVSLAGITFETMVVPTDTTLVDLGLTMSEIDGELFGCIRYNADLFEQSTIERIANHFVVLLAASIAEPHTPVQNLQLLPEEEMEHVLETFNRTQQSSEPSRFVHEYICAQARKTPDAIALVFGTEHVSYKVLDQRSGSLALYLRNKGIRAESRVGVYMERGLDLVIALLAILKAGAVYVALDLAYPARRLEFMLGNAAVSILLTHHTTIKDSPILKALDNQECEVVELDNEWDSISKLRGEIRTALDSTCAAYLLHTSGSTGRPKGVVNTHGGLANRLLWMQEYLRLRPEDRVLHKTPIGFDVSVWELLWPIMFGATMVIARPEGHKDPEYLRELMELEGITHVHFVPSMLSTFLDSVDQSACPSILHTICSGEALSYDLALRSRRKLAGQLHNLYGPTEAAIDVTAIEIDAKGPGDRVSIGRPISNISAYVLDDQLQPSPIGVPGELYLGGAGLARGYVNQPDLTAMKFLPSPFSSRPGERLYRTGDKARWRPNGSLDFLGRLDDQLKIRGFRVEPVEVESLIRESAGIKDAVVVGRNNSESDVTLAAYIVREPGLEAGTTSELRAFLRDRLPDHMIPSAFVELDSIPRTSNGKIDRRSLPEPTPSGSSPYVAPRTETERQLCDIWSSLLGVERVGVEDNFFELGGHSLLATKMVSRMEDVFSLEIPLGMLFETPTIACLATKVDRSLSVASFG